MKFINNGEAVQVRESDGPGRFKWTLLYKGETIELPEAVGRAYGFKKVTKSNQKLLKVTEGKVGKTKVETKQFYTPDDLFYKELIKIKGIGKKTAEDIVNWGTKEKLIEVIKNREHLPFRDDVELKLRKKYGK